MFKTRAIFIGDRIGSWVYLHWFASKSDKINFIFNAIKVNDKLWVLILRRQVAIQPIFMWLVLKISLSLVLRVLIHKVINSLSGMCIMFIYTKYSYLRVRKVWMRAQPKRVIEKKNPLVENVFLTIGIEWAYLRQNRRNDRNRFWTFSRGITPLPSVKLNRCACLTAHLMFSVFKPWFI